ncbi:ABC transporter ATP-binding protein [Hymenobacter terrenus]|uniref:ABC transporter ATP-binding protein n=1 Tax=Hymenobacter terrenus TaxID=1629124 RepID=UPI0006193BA2|nr:ABC transporter ATP-binding protein [Hymenobacter terrenus]
MIELHNVQKVYRPGGWFAGAVETPALQDVSLHVAAGDFVAVMGPSGCGKSTLLNVLGLLDTIDRGQYLFEGTNVTHFSERQRDLFRQPRVGFIFQDFNLIDELTVYQNVEMPLVYGNVAAPERKQRVEAVLERLQLMHRCYHRPGQLSGGQQQRAAIARAVVGGPRLLLADEPTGNLDSVNGEAVMRLLADLNAAGMTVVMATHSEQDARYAHRTVRLYDGEVLLTTH